MFQVYFVLIVFIAISSFWLINQILKRKIKKKLTRILIQSVIVISIAFAAMVAPFYTFFSMIPAYPIYTKQIDDQYYYKQQEFGFATTMPGTNFQFCKKRLLWFDKVIGEINWNYDTDGFDLEVKNITDSRINKKLIINVNNKISLDTIVNFDEYFYIKYYNRE
ncbi:MAG: hypothetical protein ACEPOZ_07090 [Marinifilaceae bacterium]